MPNISPLPELTDGALVLLRVANENDRYHAMADNAALYAALDLGMDLLRNCRKNDAPRAVTHLLDLASPPRHFLDLAAGCLQKIRTDLSHPNAPPARGRVVSDFDWHVLQGFAAALADLAWAERQAANEGLNGPPFAECCTRLGRCEPAELWHRTLQHYLANILQHYFAAARIREQVRDLPADTEENLQLEDARDLARYILERTPGKEAGSVQVVSALRSTLAAILDQEEP